MKSDTTDVFAYINLVFDKKIGELGLTSNKELAAFLHYNMHNVEIDGIDYEEKTYKPFIRTTNLNTGSNGVIVYDEDIHNVPNTGITLLKDKKETLLSISHVTKCVKIDDDGLYIESMNLNNSIVLKYYDNVALERIINKVGESINKISVLDAYISGCGISPDFIVFADLQGDKVTIRINENGEDILNETLDYDKKRTLYSTFYEFMVKERIYSVAYRKKKI